MPISCHQNQLVTITSRGLWLLAAVASSALGQTRPDAGLILQETRPAPSAPAPTIAPIQAPAARAPAAAATPGGSDVRVQVSQFEFSGNYALSTETLNAAVAPWAGRALDFGELNQSLETAA